MFEFFDEFAPENEERISDTRADKIKTSVLSRVEEDKPMKKHFKIKPFVIAAAVAATGAASVVTANAATDGAIIDELSKTFSFVINGEEISGTFTAYSTEDGINVDEAAIDIIESGGGEIIFDGDYKIVNLTGEDISLYFYDDTLSNAD